MEGILVFGECSVLLDRPTEVMDEWDEMTELIVTWQHVKLHYIVTFSDLYSILVINPTF